jgi:4a-hydroxytetrahydrobiopterin dehydratase
MFAVSAALSASARVAPADGASKRPSRPERAGARVARDGRDFISDRPTHLFRRSSFVHTRGPAPRHPTDLVSAPFPVETPDLLPRHTGARPRVASSRPAASVPARFPRGGVAARALGNEKQGTSRRMEDLAGLGGDFGARDPTAGELESNFNAKCLGEADTEHFNKIPEGMEEFTALHTRSCVALSSEDSPCEERQALVYQKQVMDWKIRVVDGHEVLRREYRTEDTNKAEEVITRFTSVAEAEGKTIDTFIEGPGVRVEIYSKAVGGLHANDFILAAKLDQVDVTDVVIKKKPQTFLI